MLLSTAWKSYEADKRIEGFSPYTLKAYGIQAKLLIGYFNDPNIDSFDTERLKEYFATQGKDLKPSSMARRIRFMKSLFRWCHEEGHIPLNPAAKIKEPKAGKRIPKFLSEREIELLREACLSPMEKALFEFMFSTGCRIVFGKQKMHETAVKNVATCQLYSNFVIMTPYSDDYRR
ncbi:hypothetical protein G3A_06430 [Bacillus sp. 17376]|uniref:Mobile element protein n=1 Tax=Mesobacillus boroniphilus JCM 21738 TaxID=1294265 RepID=W4RW75_9BACI|nr:hypothetical protein G3A_06430 [Bacillus sp. 17376]GAE48372.1 mobile element protein [Mesobacillus boroniphilus JCM 21738]